MALIFRGSLFSRISNLEKFEMRLPIKKKHNRVSVLKPCVHFIRPLKVVGHGYCAALKECADLGFVVN